MPLSKYREESSLADSVSMKRSSNGSSISLAYAGRDVTATRSELGLPLGCIAVIGDTLFTLRGRAAWAHNFDTARNTAATSFRYVERQRTIQYSTPRFQGASKKDVQQTTLIRRTHRGKSVCAFVIGVGKMFSDLGAEVRVPQLKLNGFVRYGLKLTMQIGGRGCAKDRQRKGSAKVSTASIDRGR